MHKVSIRPHIVERVMKRRGDLHWFSPWMPSKSALLVIDMQNTFCMPGAPGEVATARDIVPNINRLAAALRAAGVPVIWIAPRQHRAERPQRLGSVLRPRRAQRRGEEAHGREPGAGASRRSGRTSRSQPGDVTLVKNRYSALAHGASTLERVLRNLGVDTVLVAGTKTDVCCDCTARDAMMLDFKVVMVSDCCAALSDEEHRAALEIFIQQFGDVMTRRRSAGPPFY